MSMGFEEEHVGRNFLILGGMILIFQVLAFIGTKYLVAHKIRK